MLKYFTGFFTQPIAPKYSVERLPNGRFGIVANDGTVFETYSRRRDAFRGAERAGINVE